MKIKEVQIGKIANFINGYAFKPTDWGESGYKIIRIQNLTNKQKPYNYTTKKVPEKYIVKKGDILVSWSATIDIFEWDDEDAYLNQHIFKVEFDEELVNKYYFKLALKKTIEDLSKLAHGATMKHVTKKKFDKHKIPLPEKINDQIKIANLLTQVEALITKRKESIELLDELIKSTFLDMFGDPVLNPKGWDKKTCIDEASCIVPGRDKPKSFSGGIPWITTTNLVDRSKIVIDRENYIGLSENEIKQVKAKIIPKNSVIFTCVGDLGIVSIVDEDIIMNQQLHSFQCFDTMNNIFMMFNISFQKSYMYKNASKTTVPYMNKTTCNKIPLILPPKTLQDKFATIVQQVEATKAHYQDSLDELKELFGSLSQRAFRGEFDLSGISNIDKKEIESTPAMVKCASGAQVSDTTALTVHTHSGGGDIISKVQTQKKKGFIESFFVARNKQKIDKFCKKFNLNDIGSQKIVLKYFNKKSEIELLQIILEQHKEQGKVVLNFINCLNNKNIDLKLRIEIAKSFKVINNFNESTLELIAMLIKSNKVEIEVRTALSHAIEDKTTISLLIRESICHLIHDFRVPSMYKKDFIEFVKKAVKAKNKDALDLLIKTILSNGYEEKVFLELFIEVTGLQNSFATKVLDYKENEFNNVIYHLLETKKIKQVYDDKKESILLVLK